MTAQPSDPVARDPVAAGDAVNADAVAAPRVRSSRRIRAEHVRDYGIVVFAVALFIYFSIASSVFLTSQNLLNLVFQNATIGIAACAVTLTIIAGNFDLSLGSIFVLSEVLGAWAAVHWGVWWAAHAPSTSLRTKIDPSERSKLPAMIVRVTAQAAMPMVAFWKTRLRRFCEVRKTDEAIEK